MDFATTEDEAMPTEYIPKSLALDIIARLCTDYAAAYAEIRAVRGITIVKCQECRWRQVDDIGTMHCHKYMLICRQVIFAAAGRRKNVQKKIMPITETCYTCAAWHEGHKNNTGTCFNGNSPYCMTVMGANKTCEAWQGKWK